MDTSAISGSSNGEGLQAEIQTRLLRKSQDIAASQVLGLVASVAQVGGGSSANPSHLGNGLDVTA